MPGTDTPVVNVNYVKYIQTAGGNQTGKIFTKSAMIQCNICHKTNLTTYIDGNTKLGGGANMCTTCHKKYGFKLGIGSGQKYEQAVDSLPTIPAPTK